MRKDNKFQIVMGVISCIAGIGAAIMAVPATTKAERILKEKDIDISDTKEVVKATWKCYTPSAALIGVSVASTIAGNAVGIKSIGALSAAAGTLYANYGKYRDKVKEWFGSESDEKILSAITKPDFVDIEAKELLDSERLLHKEVAEDDNDFRVFYDPMSNTTFKSTLARVMNAEYHINREFALSGYASYNQFREFLGLESLPEFDGVAWAAEDGYMWIDFDNKPFEADNITMIGVQMNFLPESQNNHAV